MRIDFSEPECSNCYHCRTLGILNTQESEPSNVTSMPVSGPVQTRGHDSASVGSTSTSSLVQPLGHDSAAIGSTSTSSPVHSSSPLSFGSAPVATTSFSSEPVQSRAPTIFTYGAPSQRPAFQAPVQVTVGSGASATSTSSTSSSFHSSSPFICGSAPVVTSVSSAPTQAFGPTTFSFGAFSAPTPPRFETMQAPVQASASQDFGKTASGSLFGNGVAFARPDIGYLPPSSSSTTTVVFGTTPVSVSSLSRPAQAPSFLPFGCVPASPTSGPSMFTSFCGSPQRCGVALTRSDLGSPPASSSFNLFEPNPWTTASGFSTSTASVSSQFGPSSDVPKLTCVCASSTEKAPLNSFFPGFGVGYLPGYSSNLFGPNPSTTTSVFGGGSIGAGVKTSSPQTFGANPNIGFHPFASHEWNRCTEGSRSPGYTPTLDGQNRDMYISISASNSYLHKSHEELRWEDYKQGVKGRSFPAAHVSPIGSRPNAVFSQSTTSPSIFASPSIPDHPQRTHFGPTKGNYTGSLFGVFPTAHVSPIGSRPNAVFSPSTTSPSTFASPSIPDHPQRTHLGTTQGNFTGSVIGGFPAAHVSPIGSGPNAVFSQLTTSPSISASPSIHDHPQSTHSGTTQGNLTFGVFPAAVGGVTTSSSSGFGQTNKGFSFIPSSSSPSSTTFPPISSSVQRPHETTAVSSPASGCTACGASSSSSASGYFTFNGATTPTSAATSHPGLFFPPTYCSGHMMFGTTLQGITPALQAYPVQGFILLPFAAMSLQ